MTTEAQTVNGGNYNGQPDWVFFDIAGGVAGQTYSINVTAGPNGNAGVGAVSFDSQKGPAWALATGGDWNTNGNWTGGPYPNAVRRYRHSWPGPHGQYSSGQHQQQRHGGHFGSAK